MNHLMACRVCLAYDIRLHSISGCQLQDIYEKFTETSLETSNMKPICVCYICFSLLKKFQKFIEKSKKSDQLLEQMINSGLELSVNSLELFCKQQTEFPWTMGKSPMVRVIPATEEELNMETPIKTEYENSEMDVGDQNEDDLDGITLELEVTSQDSATDSEDNLPLQNISKQLKADRSNVSEIKMSKILNPDAREIILSKEEHLQHMLEQSKSLNYQNSPFKCDLCYEGFVDTKAFENHQKKHAEGGLSKEEHLRHMLEQSKSLNYQNSPFKCDLSYKGFVDTKAFENHQEKHAEVLHLPKKRKSDKETEKEILKCQAPMPNNEKTTYNINSVIKNSKTKANTNEQVTAPNNIFICDVCKKEYLCKSLLHNHIKKWHIGMKGKDVLKNYNVTKNKLSKNKNKLKVSMCSDETQHKCSYCKKCFSASSALTTHVRIHTGEKPYKCSYCKKYFTDSGNLASHVRFHTGEKPYKCSYCTKCFTTSGSLASHVRFHTGEKPYKCVYCKKCFSQSGNLARHVRFHTGEKPYKCSYCTKCFTISGSLATHVRIHTGEQPYKCSSCPKCFTTSGSLAAHVRIHTGEKPYKCSYCKKCFNQSSALATHVRRHTGEKPYKCSYCRKRFTRSGDLAKHVRSHIEEMNKISQ